MSGGNAPAGLLLSDDLLFTSRVTGTARSLGLEVRTARDAEGLVAMARVAPPAGVLIDLGNPGLDLSALIASLAEACPAPPRVVAYGSHVDTETLRAARAAGCDPVLPRSKFVEDMPRELPAWLGEGEGRTAP
jgi:DNA-binding NarL/FixJ family response regulator